MHLNFVIFIHYEHIEKVSEAFKRKMQSGTNSQAIFGIQSRY